MTLTDLELRGEPTQHAAGRELSATPSDCATVAVVGLGYVGLPTAISLVEAGRRVIGIDVSDNRLDRIRVLDVDMFEDDRVRLDNALRSRMLELHRDASALAMADAVVVCVPTPVSKELVPDLGALRAACAAVVEQARAGQTIILTSTTYVGSTRDLIRIPLEQRGLFAGRDVAIAFSPERIDPGVRGHSPSATPRIVGGVTPSCTRRAAEILADTCPSIHRVASAEAAELAKLLENTFRAVNIAMVNEFADIASGLSVDIREVIDAAATKPYGFMRFNPGPGVGGHCIPCDPHYLLWQLRGRRHRAPLIEAAMSAIAARPMVVVARIREELGNAGRPLAGAHVHLVGVAYKPGVADVRESPALDIIEEISRLGAKVTFCDPAVGEVRLHDGTVLRSTDGRATSADLYLVHTLDPAVPVQWLEHKALVVDATYTLSPHLPHVVAL